MNYFQFDGTLYASTYAATYSPATYLFNYTYNQAIQYQDQLYFHHDGRFYQYIDPSWVEINLANLPEQVSVTDNGGLEIKYTLQSDKYTQGEYIGDPVEEVSNTCICPMNTLMSYGCKCGGE